MIALLAGARPWGESTTSLPVASTTPPSGKGVVRIFGPGRSTRIPTSGAAWRIRRNRDTASWIDPWARGTRATSIPASRMADSVESASEAGPTVATTRVRRACSPRQRRDGPGLVPLGQDEEVIVWMVGGLAEPRYRELVRRGSPHQHGRPDGSGTGTPGDGPGAALGHGRRLPSSSDRQLLAAPGAARHGWAGLGRPPQRATPGSWSAVPNQSPSSINHGCAEGPRRRAPAHGRQHGHAVPRPALQPRPQCVAAAQRLADQSRPAVPGRPDGQGDIEAGGRSSGLPRPAPGGCSHRAGPGRSSGPPPPGPEGQL